MTRDDRCLVGPGKAGCTLEKPRPKPRRTYDAGFRAGVLFAVAIQVIVFAAVGAGAAVIALLPA